MTGRAEKKKSYPLQFAKTKQKMQMHGYQLELCESGGALEHPHEMDELLD